MERAKTMPKSLVSSSDSTPTSIMKRKKPKAPNPLSCKKKKQKPVIAIKKGLKDAKDMGCETAVAGMKRKGLENGGDTIEDDEGGCEEEDKNEKGKEDNGSLNTSGKKRKRKRKKSKLVDDSASL